MKLHRMSVMALTLGVACASTQARIQSAYDEPDDEAYVAWMLDRESAARDGELSETDLARMVDKGLEKWPESWELHAVQASSLVRQGKADEAAKAHEVAAGYYYQDPYCGEPMATHSTNMGLALSGSLLVIPAILIIAVVTDDVVIEYPAEPTEVTWVPSIWRDAYRCIDEYSPAEIAVLAEATRRASLAASDSDQDDGTQ